MKRLKIILRFIEPFKIRPLFLAAIIILIIDIIYVNLIFKWPSAGKSKDSSSTSCICGKVREKNYDEEGRLKTMIVEDTLCYVNNVPSGREPSVGSLVKATGDRVEFTLPMNKGGFNQRNFYGSNRVFFYQFTESFEVLKTPVFSPREVFLNIRKRLTEKVNQYCPKEAGTINTLLLADKSGLSENRKSLYQRAGVGHFLVISGLHISAVGLFIYRCLRRMGLKTKSSCLISMAFLFSYGMLVGFSVSVIRALIMFFVRLFADIVRKIYDMLSAVSLSLLVTVLVNPLVILNSGFIYSYVTVFAISVYITYSHPKKLRILGKWDFVRESLRIPVVLWLFVMPVTLCLSYEYSLASILINAVLAPMAGPIIFVAFLGLGFSCLKLSFLAMAADWVLGAILGIFDLLCKLASKADFFTFIGQPDGARVVIYYIFLLCFLFWLKDFMPRHLCVILPLFAVAFLAGMRAYRPFVSMLYVGQGDCLVVSTAPQTAVVVDCGSTSENMVGKYTVEPYLKAMGINKIQGIFVSHSDADHLNGVFELLNDASENGFSVSSVFLQNLPVEMADDTLLSLYSCAKENDIPVFFLEKGDEVRFSNVNFTCLWPSQDSLTGEANGDSMVLLMKEGNFSMLFTGDATAATEEAIASEAAALLENPLDVLKVSHHGSKTATSEILLSKLRPSLAIISAGIDNPYGHPNYEVLSRLTAQRIPYIVTSASGCIYIAVPANRGRVPISQKANQGRVPISQKAKKGQVPSYIEIELFITPEKGNRKNKGD